ncbi:hypothetical protein PGB90_006326 [Kerria lacca]
MKTYILIKEAYSDEERLSRATVFRWHASLCSSREFAALFPHPGQKSTQITDEIVNTATAIIRDDRHLSVRALGAALDVSKDIALRILRNHLNMRKVCFTWVPHMLKKE